MYSNNRNGSCAVPARGFMALFAMLAMGLGLLARPAEAAPFAYVANDADSTVSVIDTATNTVVATIAVGSRPSGVAVTPDGKHAYVANGIFLARRHGLGDRHGHQHGGGGHGPGGEFTLMAIAVTPDGKHVYVVNFGSNNVSVIDTATNTVVATVAVGSVPAGSPSPRMGNTPMSRMMAPTTFR